MTFVTVLLVLAVVAVAVVFITQNGDLFAQNGVRRTDSIDDVNSIRNKKPLTFKEDLNLKSIPNLVTPPLNLNFTARILPTVKKPPSDKREYRSLELLNKMKVILVSDPETDKAAAAVNVMTGSLQDPDELLGLAHYLEHLLFLGTEKYPQQDAYEKYLAQYAGNTNAYTQDDDTCYYFALSPEGLEGALDRFAQFFIAPLFTEKWNEREVNAVNSEYEGSLVSEWWRLDGVNRFLSNSTHPYRRFVIGNKKSLWTRPQGKSINVRKELIKFFETHYSSNVMSLVVLGRESLDELQVIVEKYFNLVPNREVTPGSWPDPPWGPEQLQRRIDLVPLMDLRKLYLYFAIPDYTRHYKSAVLDYTKSLIQYGGPGSILSLLKKKRWASGIAVYVDVPGRGFSIFNLEISLTPKGLENVDDVILHIFQYLAMLREMEGGEQERYWKELKIIKENEFRFIENQEADDLVVMLAAAVPDYPIEDVWSSNYNYSDYQPELIENLLSYLIPEKVRVITQTKENQKYVTHKEEYMGTEYSFTLIDLETMQKWINCGLHPELKFPSKNEFIPTNFDLKPRDIYTGTIPRIIFDDGMSRLWFLQDQEYKVPRASIALDIANPYSSGSVRNTNLQNLFVKLIQDGLLELIYSASKSGMSTEIISNDGSIFIQVYGYDDKIGVLFDQVLNFVLNYKTIMTPSIGQTHHPFEDIKENYIRRLNNTKDQTPVAQAEHFTRHLLDSQQFSYLEQLASVIDLTLDDVMNFAEIVFSEVRLNWVIYGNMQAKEALELHQNGLKQFRRVGATALSQGEVPPVPTQVKLPIGSNFLFKTEVEGQTQSAVQIYFQSEMLNLREEWIILLILDQILSEECFTVLRTKEQLGYRVYCNKRKAGSLFPGYEAGIQGGKHPSYAQSRINHFLSEMAMTINNLTQTDLAKHKKSVQTVINSGKSKTLYGHANAIGLEMERGSFDFDKENEQLEQLKKIGLDLVQNYFNTWINPASKKRKTLTVHIISQEQAKEELVNGEELKFSELVQNGDGTNWKKRLGFFPLPKPFTEIPSWPMRTRR